MSSRAAEQSVDPTALPSLESSLNAQAQSNEIWVLAVKLQHRLPQIQFSKTPSMEIFNAMDAPWIQRSIRVSLNEQRSKIFAPALTALPDWNLHRIF
jgi:hypothetical protein